MPMKVALFEKQNVLENISSDLATLLCMQESSVVTDGEEGVWTASLGKLNVKTGPPLSFYFGI